MFENLGGGEVVLIFLVVLIFFGPKKIPELAGSLGKGLRKFRDAKDGLEGQIKTAMKEPMDALHAAKTNFEQQVQEASKPIQETATALNSYNTIPAATTPSNPPAPTQPPAAATL